MNQTSKWGTKGILATLNFGMVVGSACLSICKKSAGCFQHSYLKSLQKLLSNTENIQRVPVHLIVGNKKPMVTEITACYNQGMQRTSSLNSPHVKANVL